MTTPKTAVSYDPESVELVPIKILMMQTWWKVETFIKLPQIESLGMKLINNHTSDCSGFLFRVLSKLQLYNGEYCSILVSIILPQQPYHTLLEMRWA